MSQQRAMADEQVLGKAYDARLMKRLWGFVRPHWRLAMLAMFFVPITVAFEVAQPYLLKLAIDDYIAASTPTTDGLGWIALGYVGLVLAQSLSSFAQLYCLQLLGQRSMHDLRLTTYRHVLSQRAAFFDRMPVGRLLTRMTNDIESINEMFASGVITLVADFVKLVAIVVIMLTLNVELALITFLVLPLLVVMVDWARRVMRNSFREIRVKLAQLNAYVAEHLSGIRVVQLFRRERSAQRSYDAINAGYRDAYLGAIRADATMYAGVEAIAVVSVACIAWWAGGRIGEGVLTVGLVVAFIEYVNKFFVPIKDLSAKYTVMQSAMASAERITALLDTTEPDAPTRMRERPPTAPDPDAPALELRDVDFAYRPSEPVLRRVSLTVPHGRTVAIVGATGSGKSTIIKLLTRLYEADAGSIRIGGVEVGEIEARALRQRITVISQDVFLFSGSVRDNVALGLREPVPGVDEDRIVRAALARVGAARMLERREHGLDDEVAERGANFSAGERQLIAFARALVRDPEILVLDEATAHVDPEAEGLIEAGLRELVKDRTTLVIAHRLSTIRNADQILVMARGQIVERGTHDELVARGGVYASLERTFARSH
ncbi:MAG TPA: ABC transporter ATP-binding protein [Kofleriaceae bacterium]|nr:ABC transporter ATP-binding protein [Kofleriaceae bacterium]